MKVGEKHLPSGGYFLLEDLELTIHPAEIDDFIRLWNLGHHIRDIHRYLRKKHNATRKFDEVVIMVFDLARKDLIKQRKKGLYQNF